MANRVVQAHFKEWATARMAFIRGVADFADRPDYLEPLVAEGVFAWLAPLLHDKIATVRATAALAIGRLARYSVELSHEIIKQGLLDEVVRSVPESHPAHMKASCFVVSSIARHNGELAQLAIDCEAIGAVIHCLEQLDVTVREAAANAVAALAAHDPEHAKAVALAGALPLLVAAVREPELRLKRAALQALCDIAGHSEDLAAAVVAVEGAPRSLILCLDDPKARKPACTLLDALVKHSAALASTMSSPGVGVSPTGVGAPVQLFPTILLCMTEAEAEAGARRAAGAVLRDVVRHSEELARLAAENGALGTCVDTVNAILATPEGSGTVAPSSTLSVSSSLPSGGPPRGPELLPPIIALGFMAAFSESLSLRALEAGAVPALKDVLITPGLEDHVRAATVWALSQVGRHSPSHARALAEADVLRHVLSLHQAPGSSEDLREKARRCLHAVIAQCDHLLAMQQLLATAPSAILRLIVGRMAAVVAVDKAERKALLGSGGLKAVLALDASSDPDLEDLVNDIAAAYPAEVVAYCRPDYLEALTAKVGSATTGPSAGGVTRSTMRG